MFWDGNQECSNLCLVLAGVLSTLPVFFFFFNKSLGILSGLGRVGLLWFWTSLRSREEAPGCCPWGAASPDGAVSRAAPFPSLHQLGAAGCSEVMLSGCGENPPG